MSFIHFPNVRLVRLLIGIVACAALLFSAVSPAIAAGMSQRSNPEQGETQLKDIYKKSEDALQNPPLSLEKTQRESNKGLNEVQGSADAEKMKRPDNSQATSFEERIEQVFEKVAK
ncbi:MAG: low temperature-induced protein [Leptolyngbyaceae cyanobacterium RU_5_1]|nr:low temperature-induced protein [Leptolyngbyaceae cyanobacterium RU_5_1]